MTSLVKGKETHQSLHALNQNVTNDEKQRNCVDFSPFCTPRFFFVTFSTFDITGRQHYRLYTIHKIPTLKVLDFQKVKQSERERASRLATSAAGAAMEADARLEARAAAATAASSSADDAALSNATMTNGDNGTNTFEPGEGKSAEESFATQFSAEEKAAIRDMVANAASAEEIDRIESLVKRGIFPGKSESVAPVNGGGGSIVPPPPPPPPPPLPEEEDGKRPVEGGGDEGGDTKRQKSE
mmetsp:Transcript_23708/g.57178  ORF Transcript_23708/g.57178 Transcript_23708/m.57178 type:complete len:241 (+) Transcript_23708:218-940(+)